PGHVLVIPNSHFENLYEFPPGLGVDLIAVTQRVAIAMQCGLRLRWHLHAPPQRPGQRPGRLALSPARLPALGQRPAVRTPPGANARPSERDRTTCSFATRTPHVEVGLGSSDLGRSRADRCQLVVTEPGVLDLKEGSTSTVGIAEQRWSS